MCLSGLRTGRSNIIKPFMGSATIQGSGCWGPRLNLTQSTGRESKIWSQCSATCSISSKDSFSLERLAQPLKNRSTLIIDWSWPLKAYVWTTVALTGKWCELPRQLNDAMALDTANRYPRPKTIKIPPDFLRIILLNNWFRGTYE